MQKSTFPASGRDGFAGLAPLAQWMLLESAYRELASPNLTRIVPALFIAAMAAVTGHPWSLGWSVAVVMGLAAGRWAAAAFDRRAATAEFAPWLRHYRRTVALQAVCLGAGGFFAAVHESLPACLLAAAAIGFALSQAGAEPSPGAPAAPRLAILAGPMALGGALRATLLGGGPGFAELTGVIVVWAIASVLLARATAFRLGAISAAVREPPAAVLDRVVPATPSEKNFQALFGRDQVTNLPNRPSFLRLLALESERAVLASTPATLLMLAWVGYEDYAARQPPAAVDAALIELATCIRTALRRRLDLLASMGDGKFAVLLPATDAFGGEVVAQAALAAISPGDRSTGAGAEAVSRNALGAIPSDEADGETGTPQSPVVIGCATYGGKGTLAATALLEFAEEALRDACNAPEQPIRHYNPTGKATRPAPFKGTKPTEATPYSDATKPRTVRHEPTGQRQFPRINPTVKQNPAGAILEDQKTP